jgi:GxxExxY protein
MRVTSINRARFVMCGWFQNAFAAPQGVELVAGEVTALARDVEVRVVYKGDELGRQRLDMVVDGKLVVETKSTLDLHKAAPRQVSRVLVESG